MVSIMFFTYFVSGHLEIYRIFTPKVCFDAVTLIVLDMIVIFVAFIFKRAAPCQTEEKVDKAKQE